MPAIEAVVTRCPWPRSIHPANRARGGTTAATTSCPPGGGRPPAEGAGRCLGPPHESTRRRLVGHVEAARQDVRGAQLLAQLLDARDVEVRRDDGARPLAHESAHERPADAPRR